MVTKVILASGSPRRQQILKEVGFAFDVVTIDVEEIFDNTIPCEEVAEFLALKKNEAHRKELGDEIIITADTVVILDDQVLGKPKNRKEAQDMLNSLAGKTHAVVSAVCISSLDKKISFSDCVEVTMNQLTADEIDLYISVFKPFDKAGAYGIQEWIGQVGVSKISGSFYSVMGLPIHLVYRVLKTEFGIQPYFKT